MTCSRCGNPTERTETDYGLIDECARCGTGVPVRAARREVALKLPGIDPGPQRRIVDQAEERVLQQVITALRLAGYEVETLVRRRKLQRCVDDRWGQGCGKRHHQQGSDGVSRRVGDLLVAVPRCAPRSWITLDTKSPTGPSTSGQRETAAKGLLFFVRSAQDALAAVRAWEGTD